LNSKVIQQYQIELFCTEIDLSDTTQQQGQQTLNSSCFILSFRGLEDSKGFIDGISSTIIRYFCSYVARGLSRWFAQTRARGVQITQKRSVLCSENTGHSLVIITYLKGEGLYQLFREETL